MSVSDNLYPVFLAITLALFLLVRLPAPRRLVLIASSYLFYALLGPVYLPLLAGVTLLTFYGASKLDASRQGHGLFFALLLLLVLAPLVYFKYAYFLLSQFVCPAAVPHTVAALILPIGISFYTFQAIGYLVDVYVGRAPAEKSLTNFLVFIAFFPKVTQGPIERADLLPRLDMATPTLGDGVAGLRYIVFGLALKLGFADTLGAWVNEVYNFADMHSALELSIATIFYSFQVYCDFAGYSLIAIGSARLFGIRLMTNFAQPYLAQSIPEFWRRWHISLSSWLRDYLFLPLVMSWRDYRGAGITMAFIITFLTAGLWHGAGWTFIVFGACHGIMLSVSHFTYNRRTALWRRLGLPAGFLAGVRTALTFLLVTLTFIFFRSHDLRLAGTIFARIFSAQWLADLRAFHPGASIRTGMIVAVAVIVIDLFCRYGQAAWQRWKLLRYMAYELALMLICYKWLLAESSSPFIYNRF